MKIIRETTQFHLYTRIRMYDTVIIVIIIQLRSPVFANGMEMMEMYNDW